jgi:hypothetical protein
VAEGKKIQKKAVTSAQSAKRTAKRVVKKAINKAPAQIEEFSTMIADKVQPIAEGFAGAFGTAAGAVIGTAQAVMHPNEDNEDVDDDE